MKKLPILLPLAISAILLSSLKTSNPPVPGIKNAKWIKFRWDSSVTNGVRLDKEAMQIPVSFNGYDKNMYMQLDLGADITMLYEKSIQSYLKAGENIRDLLETKLNPKDTSDSGQSYGKLKPVSLLLDKQYKQANAYLYLKYGDAIPKDLIARRAENNVGTIGADICQNKIVVIDYPNQQICFLDTLDKAFSQHVDFTRPGWLTCGCGSLLP